LATLTDDVALFLLTHRPTPIACIQVELVAADAVKAVGSQQEEIVTLRQQTSTSSGIESAEVAEIQAKLKSEQVRGAIGTQLCNRTALNRAYDLLRPAYEQVLKERLRKQVHELTEEMEMLEDDKARLQDLVTVKERMVSDERVEREKLEAKMKRITSKVKSTSASLSKSQKENSQHVAS